MKAILQRQKADNRLPVAMPLWNPLQMLANNPVIESSNRCWPHLGNQGGKLGSGTWDPYKMLRGESGSHTASEAPVRGAPRASAPQCKGPGGM